MKEGNTTQPDEATLTLWMDGDLDGEKLRHVEQWADKNPELIAQLADSGTNSTFSTLGSKISGAIPSSVEPPYPEFFNQQVLRSIREEDGVKCEDAVKQSHKKSGSFWQWFAVPMAAAGMAACFFLGTQMNSNQGSNGRVVTVSYSSVYTPDATVTSDIFESSDEGATIIVLKGLDDLPDDLEIVTNSRIDGGEMTTVTVNDPRTFY